MTRCRTKSGRSRRQTATERTALLRRLSFALNADSQMRTLLAQSASAHARSALVEVLRGLATAWGQDGLFAAMADPFSALIDYISRQRNNSELRDALEQYWAERKLNRKIHRFAVEELGLNRDTARSWVGSLPKHRLHRLATPYPPLAEHVVESDEIDKLWREHIETGPRPDKRQPRRPLHRLDPDRLTLTVGPEEGCVLVDADDGSIIGVVLRGLAGESQGTDGFLSWARDTIKDGIKGRRSIRKEDTGMLVQVGYTAGARSRPSFNWVRNLLRRQELSPDFLASSDYQTSCLFALAWNLIRARLPEAISTDWIDFLRSNGLPAMDAGIGTEELTGDYVIQFGDDKVTFHEAELAPPTGLLNLNYSRAIHWEHQPHAYSVQWIIDRTHGEEYGGHFYISSYGVRIINTSDTLIAWRPTDRHGTSLAAFSPHDPDPEYEQVGICFVTSNRLATVFQRYGSALHRREAPAGAVSEQSVPQFGKRWTAEDDAAEEAAQEFIDQIVEGVLMSDECPGADSPWYY
ncbi:hypothetical protein OH77DRAFT_585922 [Trametes cingulata]|nr:hypothetical protein OH77DRAFT_585922 [Trametes cingulata]